MTLPTPNAPTAAEGEGEPDFAALVEHLERCTHMNVTSADAETSQAWANRRNKARAILFDRIAALLAGRRGEDAWKALHAEMDERLQMAAGQRDAARREVEEAKKERERVRDVHLRRHYRLAAALGLDDGYSVDATIDEAIRRAALAATQEPR